MTPQLEDPHEEIGAAVREAARAVHAPARLQARVQAERQRRGRDGSRRQRWLTWSAGALATAAVAVAAVGLVDGGTTERPTVAAAASLALSAPTGPPPAVAAGDEAHIDAAVGSLRFPNYRYTTHWQTVGVRRDDVAGRRAVTVLYRVRDTTVGYTIVDGPPLPVPAGARRVMAGGVRLAVLEHQGAPVVTWTRAGHTCVLAGRRASLRALRYLAAWA